MSQQPPSPTANHHLKVYHRIATLFFMMTLAVVGLVAYVILTRAQVVVMSAQQPVDADFIVDVSRRPEKEEVPGEVLELTDTMTAQFPSASLAKVEAHSEGTVKISTALGRPQTLIATTRLLTSDEILFRIKKTVVVPASGFVTVDAFADVGGSSGDIGMATFTIPGLNPEVRKYFTVESVTPMTGGTKDVHMVTKEDIEQAAKVLREKLEQQLGETLRQKAGTFSGEFMTTDTVIQTTDVPIGSEAEQFKLTLTAKTTGIFYDKAQFDKAIELHIRESVPFDRSFLRVEEGGVAKTVEKTDLASGLANVRVRAKGVTIISATSPSLDPAKLTGITVDAATEYLEKIDGVASASVRVSPFWAGRTPNIARNIKVEVR